MGVFALNLAKFLLHSRGPVNLAKRVPTIFRRFGVTEKKIRGCLNEMVDISQRYGANPTLAITANILARQPGMIQDLQRRGVEFAIHGLVHTDYSSLGLEEHIEHISRAKAIFENHDIEYFGFRCPYLRYNSATLEAVDKLGFKWESSDVVSWDVLSDREIGKLQKQAYEKLLTLYSAKSAQDMPALPRRINGFIEIPVSIPDDEAIVDRLGFTDLKAITEFWVDIFNKSYRRGDLFTMQLHHERVPFLGGALDRVLKDASLALPRVWIAKLNDIADWFIEREQLRIAIRQQDGGYRVTVNGSERATVLLRNGRADAPHEYWYDGYRLVKSDDFIVFADRKPCIGVDARVSESVKGLLRLEGFLVEESDRQEEYSVYLSGSRWETRERVLAEVEASGEPVVRIWRWPHGARSALSVTGDIDSITLVDFVRRVFEV